MVSTVCLKNVENKDNWRVCLQAMIAVYSVPQQYHGRFITWLLLDSKLSLKRNHLL